MIRIRDAHDGDFTLHNFLRSRVEAVGLDHGKGIPSRNDSSDVDSAGRTDERRPGQAPGCVLAAASVRLPACLLQANDDLHACKPLAWSQFC